MIIIPHAQTVHTTPIFILLFSYFLIILYILYIHIYPLHHHFSWWFSHTADTGLPYYESLPACATLANAALMLHWQHRPWGGSSARFCTTHYLPHHSCADLLPLPPLPAALAAQLCLLSWVVTGGCVCTGLRFATTNHDLCVVDENWMLAYAAQNRARFVVLIPFSASYNVLLLCLVSLHLFCLITAKHVFWTEQCWLTAAVWTNLKS